jgi:hypothetical protein
MLQIISLSIGSAAQGIIKNIEENLQVKNFKECGSCLHSCFYGSGPLKTFLLGLNVIGCGLFIKRWEGQSDGVMEIVVKCLVFFVLMVW